MGEGPKKQQISAGLLAHVRASRREPHLKASSPVRKPGIFLLCGRKSFARVKNTTICCGFIEAETAAYGG